MLLSIIIFAGLFGAIGQYLDKRLVGMGIGKNDYFYYMCLSMLPFSLIMIIIEYFTGELRFCINVVPVILLFFAMFFRYKKQHTIVGCLKYLNPYEDSAYLTLGIVLSFIIDIILGIETFNYISLFSILLTIIGVFTIANSKLKIRNFRKDLFTRIFASLTMGYITHYILQYWSTAVFMFCLNLFLTIIFSKKYTYKYNKEHSKIIKWVFIQQTFGFFSLYLSNILSSHSVTLSSYVRPMSIIIVVIISIFIKDKNKKPKMNQILSIILVIIGISLINIC